MPQTLPSLNALRVFESASRHLSFSKAAEELHVTPAAVSHQVKSLEEHLGVPLFHRLNRGLALTDAAIAGLPYLQKGFCAVTKAVERMRGGEESTMVAVEAAPSFTAEWLVPRLPRFALAHPDIDLRIAASVEQLDNSSSGTDVRSVFRAGGVDVAVRFGHGEYAGCRTDRLFRVAAVPLCSPGLLDGAHPLREPADLRHHTLLHDETPYDGHPGWADWLSAAGVTGVSVARGVHFNSVSLSLQAAVEGQGVALGIEALAAEEIAEGRLVAPFDFRMKLKSAYYLLSLEETADVPRVAAFRSWILGEAQRFRAEFPEP